MRLKYGYQNLGEAPPTKALKATDITFGSELQQHEWRAAFNSRGLWTPERDRKQAAAWRPKFEPVRKGYVKFHDSGKEEGWDFATPRRGLLWMMFEISGVEVVFWCTHILNAWNPRPGDRIPTTDERRAVVMELEIPKVEHFLAVQHNKDRVTVGAGDMNSLIWDGNLRGVRQVTPRKRLDRGYVSPDRRVNVLDVDTGDRTSSGGQKAHPSIVMTLDIKGR